MAQYQGKATPIPTATAYPDQERGWQNENVLPPGDAHAAKDDETLNKCARIVVAILLPPLGVFFQTGCNKDLAINTLLTLLGYVPGIIHALYVILSA